MEELYDLHEGVFQVEDLHLGSEHALVDKFEVIAVVDTSIQDVHRRVDRVDIVDLVRVLLRLEQQLRGHPNHLERVLQVVHKRLV